MVNIPVGLLYVASRVIPEQRVDVEILDCRIRRDWREYLRRKIAEEDILLVGVSVMSGLPVFKGVEVNRLVKSIKDVPVVWGGAHPTILPEKTLELEGVDFCVRGFGSRPFQRLVASLLEGSVKPEAVKGLCYKQYGQACTSEIEDRFEDHDYKKIPYELIDAFVEKYFEGQSQRMFSIYSVWGCVYQCAFCISPVWYKELKKKWVPFPPRDVVDHIEFLIKRYSIDFVYFIDDDTFVKLDHFAGIARELESRKINIRIGIRGLRINEADKMNVEDLALVEKVGGRLVHIGVESGSDRMLKIMKKGITVEQSIRVNKKMAGFENIIPMYNILCGIPSETIEDLKDTGRFMLRLAQDNPNCIIFDPGKFIPYPGSKLYDLAIEYGFKLPSTPEEWKLLDQECDIYQPWYTPKYNRYIKMLQVTSYALSNWEAYLEGYTGWLRAMFHIAKVIYRPVAKARIRLGFSQLLLEYPILEFLKRRLLRVT